MGAHVQHHLNGQSAEPLYNRGIVVFERQIFDQIREELRRAILMLLTEHREGRAVDEELLKGCVEIFTELGVNTLRIYQQQLEEDLLKVTAEFYARQAAAWLSTHSFPDYLAQADEALSKEELRCALFMHSSTLPKLRAVVIDALLRNQQAQLLEKDTGPVYLLDNEKRADLARLHKLFSFVEGGLVPVSHAFRQYVAEKGLQQASKQEVLADGSFIQQLLDLHDRFKLVVTDCFSNDAMFQTSLKEAFEMFVNRDLGKFSFASLMSSFCDRLLKKSGERLPDDQIEARLARVVELFSFLTDKDLFADIYRTQLAKRLLQETSASEDMEKSIIQKLKLKCGAQFTSKLEGMITDLNLSHETSAKFREYLTQNPEKAAAACEFSIAVLTTGFWPTYQAVECFIPPEIGYATHTFEEFYDGFTQHRKLQWVHGLGTTTVAARFGAERSRRHDLVCNTLQAVLLLLFNSVPDDADASSGLPVKVLSRSGTGRTIDATEVFWVNVGFQCAHRKIKIPPPVQEEAQSKERVEEDRSIAIEASIVRVMKARKTLSHQQLVTEVLTQLSFFRPNPRTVKQRIEHLIEREYLARDETDQNNYNYLA